MWDTEHSVLVVTWSHRRCTWIVEVNNLCALSHRNRRGLGAYSVGVPDESNVCEARREKEETPPQGLGFNDFALSFGPDGLPP
jgi:hypothetical protein